MSAIDQFERFLKSPLNSHRVRKDGTLTDTHVETHFHLAMSCRVHGDCPTPYVEIIFDDGGVDGATRILVSQWLAFAETIKQLQASFPPYPGTSPVKTLSSVDLSELEANITFGTVEARKEASNPFSPQQQQWTVHPNPVTRIQETALFAGFSMDIVKGDSGNFRLQYLGFTANGFTSLEQARGHGPWFAKLVLFALSESIEE